MKNILAYLILASILSSCSVSFTLNGASVPDNLKTFSVQYFENRAPLINPSISQNFTEGLKDRISNESRLTMENKDGDIEFSGEITGYSVRPMAIQADAVSAETRLTMTVKVRYRNFKDPKDNWESSFSAYQEYSSEKSINDVEEELTGIIIEELTENIFNKAFSDW